jgi:hypothetical protein
MVYRIALCFSGHPRTFESSFSSIKSKLIDKYDCDVFISTYKTSEGVSDRIINLYNPKKIVFNDEGVVQKQNIDYLNRLGNIKTYRGCLDTSAVVNIDKDVFNNENYDLNNFFNFNKATQNDFIYRTIYDFTIGQFFGIYDVSKLCLDYVNENNIQYDYILRLRLDACIENDFIIRELKENEILVNEIANYSNSIKVNDHFFMAKQDTYFKLADLYNKLPEIVKYINENCWLPFMGYQETFLFVYIIMCNIKIKESYKDFTIKKLE